VTSFVKNVYQYRLFPTNGNDSLVKYKGQDVPEIVSKHCYTFYPKSAFSEIFPFYEFKGLKKFYDINWLFSVPKLLDYIYKTFEKWSLQLDCDCIVSAEARGFIVGSVMADRLKLPLFLVRKKGKLPGPIESVNYSKAYEKDVLEINKDNNLKGKNVVVFDDGIATGNTVFATKKLIEKLGGQVVGFGCIIRHTYTEIKHELPPVFCVFDL
jgi:adenine phosphoribosyltransferase